MHKEYYVSAIFNQNLIASIAAYENNIIIGTKIGQLFTYTMQSQDEIIVRKLQKYHETADKKPICQMKVVPEENLLFVLTYNGVINVYHIGGLNFGLIHCCEETMGCNIFEVDVKTSRSSTSKTITSIRLCVSIKHSLRFFHWSYESDRLESLANEISLEAVPKAISWKDNIICIGFKDEYAIYNASLPTPEKNKLVVTSSLNNIDPCVTLINKSVFGITKDDSIIFIDGNNLTEEETLVENMPKSIKWSSSVFELVWDDPFAIGLTDNGVEVHILQGSKSSFIQTIPQLNEAKFLARSNNGHIFAASTTRVWYMLNVKNAIQRDAFLSSWFENNPI